jgi:hypothetical protein
MAICVNCCWLPLKQPNERDDHVVNVCWLTLRATVKSCTKTGGGIIKLAPATLAAMVSQKPNTENEKSKQKTALGKGKGKGRRGGAPATTTAPYDSGRGRARGRGGGTSMQKAKVAQGSAVPTASTAQAVQMAAARAARLDPDYQRGGIAFNIPTEGSTAGGTDAAAMTAQREKRSSRGHRKVPTKTATSALLTRGPGVAGASSSEVIGTTTRNSASTSTSTNGRPKANRLPRPEPRSTVLARDVIPKVSGGPRD